MKYTSRIGTKAVRARLSETYKVKNMATNQAGGPVKDNMLTYREPLFERLVIKSPVKIGYFSCGSVIVHWRCCPYRHAVSVLIPFGKREKE